METNTKLTIGGVITLALLLSGVYYIAQDDDAYYCEAKDMVRICEKLSAGIGTRCYYEETYRICTAGWVKLEKNEEIVAKEPSGIPPSTAGSKWKCSPIGCVVIE